NRAQHHGGGERHYAGGYTTAAALCARVGGAGVVAGAGGIGRHSPSSYQAILTTDLSEQQFASQRNKETGQAPSLMDTKSTPSYFLAVSAGSATCGTSSGLGGLISPGTTARSGFTGLVMPSMIWNRMSQRLTLVVIRKFSLTCSRPFLPSCAAISGCVSR